MQQNDQRRLFEAARSGDIGEVRRILASRPALVSAHDPACFGATPLIHASNRGDRAMIDALLELGADPDQASDWWAGGFRPLDGADEATSEYLLSRGATLTVHAASRLGKLKELEELLELEPALVHSRGGDGQLPLHFARSPEVAALLLDRGAPIDAKDIDHASTAAQWAAMERPSVSAFLVERGAAADAFMACAMGDAALAQQLVEREPEGVHAKITRERFPAPGSQALGIYHYTIGTGCGLLHAAANAGNAPVIRLLLSLGADANATGGYDDQTPLHAAAWHDRVGAAAALLDGGADMERRSGRLHNNTPLGWAIVGGSVGVVGLLLERGAEVLGHMPADAARGAEGVFRQFKPRAELASWARIADLLARSGPTAGSRP